MKILRFLPLAAIALVAVSCQNAGNGQLSATASQTDSLMYYLGQLNGADYLRDASRDTTLKEMSQKQAYINGVRAGLAALKEGDENYNKGVMLGMQMASQMISYSAQMEVTINRSSYINSLTAAVMADTMPNVNVAQTEFRKVMQNIETAKDEKDKATSRETLKSVAATDNLPEINEDLYGKVTTTTDGAQLADGDDVTIQIQITKEDGENIGLPLPPRGTVGNRRNFPEVISQALLTLKSGETGEFVTTAHALMGSRSQQLNLKATDILKMTITATVEPKEEKAE